MHGFADMPDATQLNGTDKKPNGIDVLARLVESHALAAAIIRKKCLEKVTEKPSGYWSQPPEQGQSSRSELGDVAALISGPNGLAGETQITDSLTSTFHWDEALPSGLALNVLRALPRGKEQRTVYVSTEKIDPEIFHDDIDPRRLEEIIKSYMNPKKIVAMDQYLGDAILFHSEHSHLYRDNGLWTRFAPPGRPHIYQQPPQPTISLSM